MKKLSFPTNRYFRAMAWLTVQELVKNYQGVQVLGSLSFSLEKGMQLGIAGETGSSKTTLLKIMAGLLQSDDGVVILDGERVLGPAEKLIPGHPKIGYLSQHFELRNHYKIREELDLESPLNKKERVELFEICAITNLLDRKTTDLSGGERQRVALARILIQKPSLLLLDEPFSNLDPSHKRSMKQVLAQLSSAYGMTTILVSHDGADLLSWAQHILLLQKGKIIQSGKPADLYYRPVSAYAAGLLGDYTLFDGEEAVQFTSSQLSKLEKPSFPFFVRPEQLQLSRTSSYGVMVQVKNTLFMGSHSLIEVYWNGKRILVQATNEDFGTGEMAFLQLKSSHNF
jgi:ABC-type sulfate/molybdate transport systems ATPase subunit